MCMYGRFRYFDGCGGGDDGDDGGGGPFAGVRNFCTARPIERPLQMMAMATTQAHSAASARVAAVFRGWLQIPPGNIKEVKALCWP